MASNFGQLLSSDPLVKLVSDATFVGWVYRIDYTEAYVMTNDMWKAQALGVPHNCFLVAAAFDPDNFHLAPPEDQEVILLRVVGSCALPHDDEMVRAKIDHFQRQQSSNPINVVEGYDYITQNQLQFGGLKCKILGTFFNQNGMLRLGSDIESFYSSARLSVYRPRREALSIIVNYIDPVQKARQQEEFQALGLPANATVEPIRIGTVRYTSTDRLHRADDAEKVPVYIYPADFLARRTAVLGMTRTGKSNTVKHLVSMVKRVADRNSIKIGQIIYDLNGEYANANRQDRGAIADVYPSETIRYRLVPTSGFEIMLTNFYSQLIEGYEIIRQLIYETIPNADQLGYLSNFLRMNLEEPDPNDYNEHNRWQVRVACYRALLYKAGFAPPRNFLVNFPRNEDVHKKVIEVLKESRITIPSSHKASMTLEQAISWFQGAMLADQKETLKSKSGKPWLDPEVKDMINLINQRNEEGHYVRGYRVLQPALPYHSPQRTQELPQEIYDHLVQGKIVILDLSVGNPVLKERMGERIARYIFEASMKEFISGNQPPNIVFYIEEAHNLIGKDADLNTTWPRIAKEGAKYKIALVYATQEVSSVHPNILSNTENWFVSHLNNMDEIKKLGRFYDFEDFSLSILRAQDVGFARVKTLSSPYVVPVQIDKFEPPQGGAHNALQK